MKKKGRCWVNVYEVTQHYGGPEEGGWWFYWYDCIESVPTFYRYARRTADELKQKYGYDVFVKVEKKRAESQTIRRPFYC